MADSDQTMRPPRAETGFYHSSADATRTNQNREQRKHTIHQSDYYHNDPTNNVSGLYPEEGNVFRTRDGNPFRSNGGPKDTLDR